MSATLLPGVSEVGLGALVVSQRFRPVPLLLWAALPNWLGGMVTYWMGYAVDFTVWSSWLGIDAEEVGEATHWVRDYGAWAGLLVWVPVIGDPIAAALGIFHAQPVITALTMLLGKAARYAIVYAGVFWGAKGFNRV